MNDLSNRKLVFHVEDLVGADQVFAVGFEPSAPLQQLLISLHLGRLHVVRRQVHGSGLLEETLLRGVEMGLEVRVRLFMDLLRNLVEAG